MTETLHTRSRRASLGGLVLQLVAFGGLLVLSAVAHSLALRHLAWYVLGGVPIWFVTLLVFRQRELAALEALDLEELRREKQATGGGEALFGEEGVSGLAFRVAEARLRWMLRWLVPGFGLATAIYLAAMGSTLWRILVARGLHVGSADWPAPANVPISMVILAIIMLATFLLSRYTSGMARVSDWQLLRGCGSYMLGNALVAMVLMVCLGVQQYAAVATWEQTLAYIIPVLMLVLALETLLNFVLDIYRPRVPGVEPRACFDSRLLGLFAEPGGIASSIAEAINYQFGFQVSQTWFYQLLQRAFVPLVATGALALWLLTCVVLVQPYEHVIVERFGRQLNAEQPLRPGLHFKLPWPVDRARHYNTGQLHQLSVGFKLPDAVPDQSKALGAVQLWTDEQHMGLEHFDFLVCPTRTVEPGAEPASEPIAAEPGEPPARESPVHLMRMEVIVQYRIRADRLDVFTRAMVDPNRALRELAWEEVSRFACSSTADSLLGGELAHIGNILRDRIGARVRELGLDVVYVGVTNIHPERTVAEAFRNVVKAEQEKVAAIREALVTENERLSKVAGDAATARGLAEAVERARKASEALNDAMQSLSAADAAVVVALLEIPADLERIFRAAVDAQARLQRARDVLYEIEQDAELGLGYTTERRRRAVEALTQAQVEADQAVAALEPALQPLRRRAAEHLSPPQVDALIRALQAQIARAYWEERLAVAFTPARLEGEAAAALAVALGQRWTIEMNAARELTQALSEREAYRVAPETYKARRLMEVLIEGLKDARKYFLAFDPGDRKVRVRFMSEDEARLDLSQISPYRSSP